LQAFIVKFILKGFIKNTRLDACARVLRIDVHVQEAAVL